MGAAGVGLVAGLGLAAAVLTGDDGPPPAVVPVPGTVVAIETPPAVLGPAGALDVDGWLNTEARSLDAARGRVTVVHFWALDCGDCTDMTPALAALLSEYGAAGLQVVSVHSPRFDHERGTPRLTGQGLRRTVRGLPRSGIRGDRRRCRG